MVKLRSGYRTFFVAVGLALITLVMANTIVSAAAPGIRWSNTTNLSRNGSKSVYPVTAFDAAGKNHVAWLEYSDDGSPNSRLMYTNNINGSYRSAYEVTDDAGKNKDHIVAIAVENNRVHLAYTDRNSAMNHTVVNLDNDRPSTGSTTRLSPGGAKGYQQSLTLDRSGRLHVAWIDNREGENYQVFHRIWNNGNWDGGDRKVRGGDDDQSFPSLASTDDGRVHIVFESGSRLNYSIFQDGNWQNRNAPTNDQVNQQALAADGSRVYVVWSTRAHVVKYNEGSNGDWGSSRQLSSGDQWSDQPSVFYSPANRRVYALWAGRLTSSSNTSILIRELQQGGISSDALKIGDAPGNWPRGAGGSSGISVVWQDKASGAEEAILRSGVPGEPSGGELPSTPVSTGTPVATATGGPTVTPTVGPTVTASPTTTPPPAPSPTATPQNVPATGSFGFADTAFSNLWTRTDSLVARNAVPYSWIWGPTAFTNGVGEYYVQSPNAARSVQYFDKSRMEINNPNAPRDQWYVTNGRLSDELITGLMQVGDAQYEQRQPAAVAVAGDPDNTFPLYSDLRSVYRQSYNSDRANQEMYRAPDGSIKTQLLANANSDPSMVITQRINGLGIPKVFWDFMNQPGQVVDNGNVVNANPLYDWRYVVGEPLTEAYWTFINVGGVQRGVLVQAFERRVLTFQPDNPAEFQVEMGNIGRHYFEWRYGVRSR